MSKEHSLSLRTQRLAYMALFVALMSICAWISVPFTVPFTLQTLAIFLAVGLLGFPDALLAVAAYLLLGAIGLPVFSGFRGGFGVLLGVTGGYLVGFLFMALAGGLLIRYWGRSALKLTVAFVLGLVLCYVFGTAWFLVAYAKATGPIGLSAALSACVIPFLIPDAIKIALAVFLTLRLKGYVHVPVTVKE